VTSLSENFYACWRSQIVAATFLRDEHFPTERLLQAIWLHQRLRRDTLMTGKISASFIPASPASKEARIFATLFCKLAAMLHALETWKLICIRAAGGRMDMTGIKISKTSCFMSFGMKQSLLKMRPQFCH
jgi:hypothetical protein